MANNEHIEMLKKGVRAWNEWAKTGRDSVIDLSGADMSGINLRPIDVYTHVELDLANLANVNLSKGSLGGASLINSDLSGANLHGTDLSGADLWGACLDGADLTGTILYDTDFTEASLDGADFSGSVMDGTRFGGVDLATVRGLDSVRHEGPCRLDIDTLFLSGGKIPHVFLRGAGVPDSLITYADSLIAEPDRVLFLFHQLLH